MKPGAFHCVTVYSVPSLALALSLLQTNAQKPTNNDLVCSSVRVVNDKRELCATFLGSEDGESLAIYDGKQDTPRLMLSVEENGNSVFFMRDSDEELKLSVTSLMFTAIFPNEADRIRSDIAERKRNGD